MISEKRSQKMKERWKNPVFKERMVTVLDKNRRLPRSQETRQKTRDTLTGYKHTEVAKANMGKARKGKTHHEESKAKIGAAQIADKNHNWKGGVSWQFQMKNHPDYEKASKNKPDRCEICLTPESELKRKLAFDHCHTTGKFRGWLCGHCNSGLGYAKDDVKILQAMIDYLTKNI